MTTRAAQLEPGWRSLTDTLDVAQPVSRSVFVDLCRRYSGPSRFYHTLSHIAQMLQAVEEWAQAISADDASALRLAVWFHDAVYDSRAGDNEEQSARLARETMTSWGCTRSMRTKVERLILTTKTHELREDDSEGALFLDADLAILGSEAPEYTRYSRAIRQEFAWVPEEDYRAGRRRVLLGFLERPSIYHTPAFLDAYDAHARENLRGEIEHLSLPL